MLLFAAHGNAQVRVWEGTLELPVYEEGAPDSNPSFDQFATNRFSYPYTLRKEITDQRVVHKLRAIYLENEYLKCSVLPDIGGHVYTCVDKISGQPMFYANPSIKKARIGYRGAWAAFGIEFANLCSACRHDQSQFFSPQLAIHASTSPRGQRTPSIA